MAWNLHFFLWIFFCLSFCLQFFSLSMSFFLCLSYPQWVFAYLIGNGRERKIACSQKRDFLFLLFLQQMLNAICWEDSLGKIIKKLLSSQLLKQTRFSLNLKDGSYLANTSRLKRSIIGYLSCWYVPSVSFVFIEWESNPFGPYLPVWKDNR